MYAFEKVYNGERYRLQSSIVEYTHTHTHTPGLCIELWKVTKVVDIKVDRENMIAGFIPRITYVDQPSYASSTREYDRVSHWSVLHTTYLITYAPYLIPIPHNSCPIPDNPYPIPHAPYLITHVQTSFPVSHLFFTCSLQIAFKYLGCVLFPLFICYAIYSLLYLEHKGWYSFVLSMSYGFLLTFGKPSRNRRRGWLLTS